MKKLDKNSVLVTILTALVIVSLSLYSIFAFALRANEFGIPDGWLNLGIGHNFLNHNFLPGQYKWSRVLWIFLQASMAKLFSFWTASAIKFMVIGLLMWASSLWFGSRILGRSWGSVFALLTVHFAWNQSVGGLDYPTVFSGGLALFCGICFLNSTTTTNDKLKQFWSILCGIFFVFSVTTNILLAVYSVFFILYMSLDFKKIKPNFIWFLFGIVFGFISLSAINSVFGREFIFFRPYIDYAIKVFEIDAEKSLWTSKLNFNQLANMTWLHLIFTMNLFCMIVFVRSRKINSIAGPAIFATWCFLNFLKLPALHWDYHFYPVVIPTLFSTVYTLKGLFKNKEIDFKYLVQLALILPAFQIGISSVLGFLGNEGRLQPVSIVFWDAILFLLGIICSALILRYSTTNYRRAMQVIFLTLAISNGLASATRKDYIGDKIYYKYSVFGNSGYQYLHETAISEYENTKAEFEKSGAHLIFFTPEARIMIEFGGHNNLSVVSLGTLVYPLFYMSWPEDMLNRVTPIDPEGIIQKLKKNNIVIIYHKTERFIDELRNLGGNYCTFSESNCLWPNVRRTIATCKND